MVGFVKKQNNKETEKVLKQLVETNLMKKENIENMFKINALGVDLFQKISAN